MKRVVVATGVALAFAVSLAAQTPAPQEKAGQAAAAAAEKAVTMKGCLRAGDTPDSYVLANAGPASETAGTTGSAAKGQTLRLSGATSDMKPHIGHIIEVTGTPAANASAPGATAGAAAGGAAAGGAAGAAGAAAGAAKSEIRFTVKTMKHLETKC